MCACVPSLSWLFWNPMDWSELPFLLQGSFLTHGSNLCLLCLLDQQADSLPLCHQQVWWYIYIPQLCPTLWDPMDCSPPSSSVHGILQAREWSGLPFPSPEDLPYPRDQTSVSCLAGRFFTIWATQGSQIQWRGWSLPDQRTVIGVRDPPQRAMLFKEEADICGSLFAVWSGEGSEAPQVSSKAPSVCWVEKFLLWGTH